MTDQTTESATPDEELFLALIDKREQALQGLSHVEVEIDEVLKRLNVERAFAFASKRLWYYEDRVKQVKNTIDGLERAIDDHMIRNGIQNIRVDGVTIYVSKQRWAKIENKELAPELLKNLDEKYGTAIFVKEGIVSQSLSAWIRERLDDSDGEALGLPPEFEGVIGCSEVVKIKTRRT